MSGPLAEMFASSAPVSASVAYGGRYRLSKAQAIHMYNSDFYDRILGGGPALRYYNLQCGAGSLRVREFHVSY